MATRPSGLRQPKAVGASNQNLASTSRAPSGTPPPEQVAPTPAKQTGTSGLPVMSRLASSNSIRRKITTPAGIQPPGSRDSGLANDIDAYIVGDVVYVNGDPNKRGRICFIGEVGFAKGDFAGIALDLPMGNHDGVVQGNRYFQCEPMHGLFTKLSRLTRDPVLESPSTPRAPQSMAGSVIMSPSRQVSRAASALGGRTPSPSGFKTPVKNTSTYTSCQIGERVIVASATGGTKIGILRYLGPTEFAPGDWAGVELLTPMGKNNGTVGGKKYFECNDKYGLFVPSSKVISSPVNKAPRRHGSRESLISMSSMASSAASRSVRRPSVRDSQCLPTCSLKAVLSEKEKHMERLIRERELDRVEFGNLSRDFETNKVEVTKLQSECLQYQKQLQQVSGDNENITRLENALEEEHRKLEDLQYTLDEEKIMKADLQAQLDLLSKKSSEDLKSSDESNAVAAEQRKEIEALKTDLEKAVSEAKSFQERVKDVEEKFNISEKTIAELTQTVKTLTEQHEAAKEEKKKILTERTGLKKTIGEHEETIWNLTQTVNEKKRREEELKEKCERFQSELETIMKQKASLEAEVLDLVNSKTDASEVLAGKIKDLNDELQDLRGKLQSTEEDKALLRRINAEFKTRIAQNEQTDSVYKKQLEDAEIRFTEEKLVLEKQFTETISGLEAEKTKIGDELKTTSEKLHQLSQKLSEAESKIAEVTLSAKEQLQLAENFKSQAAGSDKQIEELENKIKKAESEKNLLRDKVRQKYTDAAVEKTELVKKIESLSDQLLSSSAESSAFKSEIDVLKAEISKANKACEEKENAMKSLSDEINALNKKTEDDLFAMDELTLEVDKLKKDKSVLKEQISAYKTESNRFKEVEDGLCQEVINLRAQLDKKNKTVCDLEKELSEKKADIDANKAQMLDASSPQAHIDFLNSIIVDLQRKNEELNIRLNIFLNGGTDADSNSNSVSAASAPKTLQSLRSYCDICEKFDLHDTEECPTQVSEDNNTHYGNVRGESRPYCDSCEIFGHVTGECDDQETY